MATVMQRDSLPMYACDQCGREAPPRASLMELERQGWHEAYGSTYLCPDCRLKPRPFGRWESGRQHAQRAAARN